MVHYIQRESNFDASVASGAVVKFNSPIALSQTGASPDFVYQSDGSIDILQAGDYTVYWYVAGMAGQSSVGQSYLLKKFDYSLSSPDWYDVVGTSNHIKV